MSIMSAASLCRRNTFAFTKVRIVYDSMTKCHKNHHVQIVMSNAVKYPNTQMSNHEISSNNSTYDSYDLFFVLSSINAHIIIP